MSTHRNISPSRLESLKRAVTGQSLTNFPAIFQGFAAKGIAEDEIKPRENVFTFDAWKALGRHLLGNPTNQGLTPGSDGACIWVVGRKALLGRENRNLASKDPARQTV